MASSGRIVVVSHEATLTGAPRVAVEVVRALTDKDRTVVAVLRAGGPLTRAFDAAADAVRREPLARPRALLRRVSRLQSVVNRLDEMIAGAVLWRLRPKALVLNTVKSACYVRPALRRGIPVALFSHELRTVAAPVLRRYPVGQGWRAVRLLACSNAARDTLAELVGVPPEDVAVVTSPVDVAAVATARRSTADRQRLVVGACGTVNERWKGTDQWLRVAQAVRHRRPHLDVRFRWIGQKKTDWPNDMVAELGLGGVVDFVGEVENPYPEMAAMDVFTLPSREDAYPLVVLEAMALGRPVVAFDVGSVADQVGGAGVVVAPGDIDAMADAVVSLLDDPVKSTALGEAAAARAREVHDVTSFHQAVRRIVGSL